ncbi:MAG: HAD hydrolase-like protein [Bryobacteraceae bacterium]|jgi:HAD superfamily phosphatase
MSEGFLVFDMDGVLVDVSESYRAAIVQTVEDFTGKRVSRELIQDYKNQGGWNDDWELSHRIVSDLGVQVEFDEIVRHFNRLFLGDGTDGLILRERWIARPAVLERLSERFQLAIFTGRRQYEVAPTLERFGGGLTFDPIVTAEMVAKLKPAPDGLNQIVERRPREHFWYVGDAIDDCRCANAAGVPFIGIAAPSNPQHAKVVYLLRAEGAVAVIDDINQLEFIL